MNSSLRPTPPTKRRIALFHSALATALGWIVGITIFLTYGLTQGSPLTSTFGSTCRIALATLIWIVPAWLFILVPIHLLASRESVLWKPWMLAAVGGTTGLILVGIFPVLPSVHAYHIFDRMMALFLVMGTAIGAATGLCAGLLQKSRRNRST
jgi:hypothetical protein